MHGVCPKGYAFSPRNQMCETNIEVDCRSCSPFGICDLIFPLVLVNQSFESFQVFNIYPILIIVRCTIVVLMVFEQV